MRIDRPTMFMEIASIVAKRSTCLRANVGAVLVDPDNNNIVSIGYNGLRPGEAHCAKCLGKGCNLVLHAEANAIDRLEGYHTDLELYTTVSPCRACTNKIINSGCISTVYFREFYRETGHLTELIKYGIKLYRILPNGELICSREFM